MSELRKDPITGRWVIVAPDRVKRPTDFHLERPTVAGRDTCPFCEGREHMTPPEVLAYRAGGGVANGPGWDVRVVPNKFPAMAVEGELNVKAGGLFERMDAVGSHEVLIESPRHDDTLATMSVEQIERVLRAFRDRAVALARDPRFQSVVLFKNHGATAGATLEHPHAQLIALPIVPGFVREELDGARRYFDAVKRCVFCDLIQHESDALERVIEATADFLVVSPYASRFPFETWLLPKGHSARFVDYPDRRFEHLARALKTAAARIDRALGGPDYNLVLHSSPLLEDAASSYHWHIEIVPRLARVAGFEWGTGFYVNHTSPEDAARALRSVEF